MASSEQLARQLEAEVAPEPIGEGVQIMEENFGNWHRWDTAVLNSTGNGIE